MKKTENESMARGLAAGAAAGTLLGVTAACVVNSMKKPKKTDVRRVAKSALKRAEKVLDRLV